MIIMFHSQVHKLYDVEQFHFRLWYSAFTLQFESELETISHLTQEFLANQRDGSFCTE